MDNGGLHAADGRPSFAAVSAVIHGRGGPPGGVADPALRYVGDGADGATVQIRGPPMGLGPSGEEDALLNCTDSIALRRPLPMPGEVHTVATEYSGALRRRSGAREGAISACVDAPADAGPAGSDGAPHSKTNEVSNMHPSSCITRASSCAGSDGIANLQRDTDIWGAPAGVRGAVDLRAVEVGDACANAAADSAWHGRERRGGADEATQPGDQWP